MKPVCRRWWSAKGLLTLAYDERSSLRCSTMQPTALLIEHWRSSRRRSRRLAETKKTAGRSRTRALGSCVVDSGSTRALDGLPLREATCIKEPLSAVDVAHEKRCRPLVGWQHRFDRVRSRRASRLLKYTRVKEAPLQLRDSRRKIFRFVQIQCEFNVPSSALRPIPGLISAFSVTTNW